MAIPGRLGKAATGCGALGRVGPVGGGLSRLKRGGEMTGLGGGALAGLGIAARAGNGLLGLLSIVRIGNIGTLKMRVDSSSTSFSAGGGVSTGGGVGG